MKIRILLACQLILFTLTPALAQSREQCLNWSEQYHRYSELRRAGGSLGQMDRWRDQQRRIEAQMQAARCLQRYGIGPRS